MSNLKDLLQPLRTAAAAFFRHEVALRREGSAVRVGLEERPRPKAARHSRVDAAAQHEQDTLALIRAELSALLNEQPVTRETMRHLVFVEQALARKGLRALHKIPVDVLQRALEQLEGLVTNWSPVGLANLRSKMAVAIIDRRHDNPGADAGTFRTASVLDPRQALSVPPSMPLDRSEEEALAAAYAALGAVAGGPAGVREDGGLEFLPELPVVARRPDAGTAAPTPQRSAEFDVRLLQP
jgi:hypothetical protein